MYREIEEEPSSQLPFILTAFGLLLALGGLIFLLFQLAGGGEEEPELITVPNVVDLLQDDALRRLQEEGLIGVVQFESHETVEVGTVIRTEPPAGTEVEPDSTIQVFVSSGPEEIEVPPVVGQTRADAERLITEAGLTVGQITERADATFAEGIVIEQDPPQGVRVGVDAPVNLVVSTGPETVIVPGLVNLSERDATAQLQALGLLVRVQDEYSDTVGQDLVIRSDPVADTEVQLGDTVLIVVSLGPAPVEVPDLVGMEQNEAEDTLAGLGLGMVVEIQPVADAAQDGIVIDQNPNAGEMLLPGDQVNVMVGQFTPPPTTMHDHNDGARPRRCRPPLPESAVIGGHEEAGSYRHQAGDQDRLIPFEDEPEYHQHDSDHHQPAIRATYQVGLGSLALTVAWAALADTGLFLGLRRFDSGTSSESSQNRKSTSPSYIRCSSPHPVDRPLENYTCVIHAGRQTGIMSSRQWRGGLSSLTFTAVMVSSAPQTVHR